MKNNERWAAIAAAYRGGASQAAIGRQHGCSGQRISQILKSMKEQTRIGGVWYPAEHAERLDEIKQLRGQGKSVTAIAAILLFTVPSLSQLMKSNNIE